MKGHKILPHGVGLSDFPYFDQHQSNVVADFMSAIAMVDILN